MASLDEEYKKILPTVLKLSDFFLMGKKIEVLGMENFVETGPSMIVGNHIGAHRDVATLFKIAPRNLYPAGNRIIFDKQEFSRLIQQYFRRHLKKFGLFIDLLISPVKEAFVSFVSSSANRIGAIPVDLERKKRLALDKCQEYLLEGRAIVILQGFGRVMTSDPHPYVRPFRRGPSIITYKLYEEEGLAVPVTPIAYFGTHWPFLVPGKIKVNIGEPMFITDYLTGEFNDTVNRFREAMEKRVKALFSELIKK